jgi:hypothetical protein
MFKNLKNVNSFFFFTEYESYYYAVAPCLGWVQKLSVTSDDLSLK